MMKKLLSMICAICMIFILLPTTIFAEEEAKTYNGLEYQISDADEVTITGFDGSYSNVIIPDMIDGKPVTTIGEYAFFYRQIMTSITIPNSIVTIEKGAFYDCRRLTNIAIPSSVISIGAESFTNCICLYSIFLPENLDITNTNILSSTSQVRYKLENDKITITQINLGENQNNVTIPETICGNEVVAVAESEQSKVGDHICKLSEATCIQKAKCNICGKELGDLASTNHNLEHVGAKDATTTEAGNIEYWQCRDCQKYFSDEEGITEISLEDTIIPKQVSEIIKGTEQSVTQGEKKAFSFTSNAAFNDFEFVKLDGNVLDPKNYTVKEGSTIVTLNSDFVSTLKDGKHTISIVSKTGEATTEFEVTKKEIVKNEDSSKKENSNTTNTGIIGNAGLWISMMISSLDAMLIGFVLKRKIINN